MRTRTPRPASLPWTVCAALAGLAGCAAGPGADVPEVAADVAESRSPLADRVIPLRLYLLSDTGDRAAFPLTDATIATAIRDANRLFLVAGVQFELAGVRVVHAPTLAVHDYSTARAWPEVRADIQKIVPSASYPDSARTDVGHWLNAVAASLPAHEVPVFVALNQHSAANASFPWYDTVTDPWAQDWSRGLRFNAWDLGALGHELGHYLGLVHTWDVAGGDPERGAAFYYDLVYATTATGVRVFTSEADARSVPASSLRPKDYANCSVVSVNGAPDATCNLGCNLNGRQYTTRDNPDVLRGLGFTYTAGEAYGINMMSYHHPGDATPCNASMAPSQARRVREALRSGRGGRAALGHYDYRFPTAAGSNAWRGALDFDGDGRRDVAVFRPATGRCHVLQSRDNASVTVAIPGYTPAAGDVPVPADYDGDGRTDCAVFRPGRSAGDWRAHWIWAKSSTGNTVGVDDTFGATGDIPLPGLDFLAGTGEYAVYRPASATFFWVRAPGGDGQAVYSRQYGVPGDVLLPGRYDGDARTDIAVYRPGPGYFSVTTSGANYADSVNYLTRTSAFGSRFGWTSEPGDVPLRGVDRDGDGRTELTLYRPRTGAWMYIQRAATEAGAAGATAAWGIAGDVPFAGHDFDGDGRSDEAIFRPFASVTAPGVFSVRRSRAGDTLNVAFGRDGLLPLVFTDRDGDALPEFVAYEPELGAWNEARSAGGTWPSYSVTRFGLNSDIPL